MKRLVKPSAVNGCVKAPASKSLAQRTIAIASMANGKSQILYAGTSDDVLSAIEVCKALGADIKEVNNKLIISGGIKAPEQPLNCGESGLGIRMFSCIVATLKQAVTLTGKGTLAKRPMGIVEQSIRAMGAHCKTQNGFIPITVKGPIAGGIARVDGALSSQVLTGILMAAPLARADTTILVNNLQSKPYIDLTIDTMKAFGVKVDNIDYKEFYIKGNQTYLPTNFTVEGDWSGAAFMLVAGAIAGSIKVKNLNPMSKQADRAIIEVLIGAGANISIQDDFIGVSKGKLNAFHFDATHCPDLFPPLVALAAHCEGESRILGVSRLRVKESDRAATLQREFEKLGIKIEIEGELMSVFGGKVNGGKVTSHGDHRIAMACAVAALAADGEVEIDGAECVEKSYPDFFEDLAAVDANIG
ncbi:MAG: 3-phosphoshikimate 1-carboxyvinyltransferase [Bacteroidales bacterium]|nr:3-phosphoshikimate 1-carboxyvinyltransferase [Bacteroidales bacterium]MDD4673690.1 3-phosphoshikimate 1-carboxyvinyltransferase [Bacteroidales bacterium]MDY0349262.1 3-phosphoshikimate 1-carboxyvinyltransferase [Tenuifilaceae bacterium]